MSIDDISSRIAGIRTDYRKADLSEGMVGENPFSFFRKWFDEAQNADISEVNAMTLATVDAANKAHARIVLLKGLDDFGFVFYTNYDSNKAKEIEVNPNASLLFFWKELERQVRIEGHIERVSVAESDEYFNSRPEGSRIGAWASPQSKIISAREILDQNVVKYQKEFEGKAIPRPGNWGGYRLIPTHFEFWQGRSNRLHDRIIFSQNTNNYWQLSRLAP